MRVLLIDQFGEMGGAQHVLLAAAAGFASRGWPLCAALPAGPLHEKLAALGVRTVALRCGPFTSVRKSAGDAVRFARQLPGQIHAISKLASNSDVLYVNGPRVLLPAVWAARDRPVVFHAHSMVSQKAVARLVRRALRSPNASVLASSHFAGGWLGDKRVRVIYNGVDGLAEAPLPRRAFTRLGVLGRIAPEKGQLLFVRAARIASAVDPGLRYVIGGSPIFASEDYFETVRREAGPEVRFTGWIDNIADFFGEMDLLVVPSEALDTNPRVIPEAYAAGVPVIAFASGGIPELIEPERTGILVREPTPEALAQAILDAVRTPERLNRIALAGYHRWKERYTLGRFQSEVSEALEDAVHRHRNPLQSAGISARV